MSNSFELPSNDKEQLERRGRGELMGFFRKLDINGQIEVTQALRALRDQNPAMGSKEAENIALQLVEEQQKKSARPSVAPRNSAQVKPWTSVEDLPLIIRAQSDSRNANERATALEALIEETEEHPKGGSFGKAASGHTSPRGPGKPFYKEVGRTTVRNPEAFRDYAAERTEEIEEAMPFSEKDMNEK